MIISKKIKRDGDDDDNERKKIQGQSKMEEKSNEFNQKEKKI